MTGRELNARTWASDIKTGDVIHLRFQFHGSKHVWDEYFPPENFLGHVSKGNNPQEEAQNKNIARTKAESFTRALQPLADVWEIF